MNILQISPRIPAPLRDGGAVYIFHVSKNLAELGHNVIMAAFKSSNHVQDVNMIKPYCKVYCEAENFKPYTISAVIKSTVFRQPVSIYHRMNKTLMAQILSRITEPVDIVLLEGIHCAWFIDVIQDRFPGKKIILRQSNVEHMVLSRNGEVSKNILIKMFYKDQARLMRGFEKQAMEQVDGVTAISASDESWFLKDVPGIKSMVVPAGADLPEIRFKRTEQKCLLAVSNWRWQPNIDGLIWFINTIWPVLKKRNPGLRFLVAGDGIPKRLKNNRHAGGIAFLGFVDDVEFYRQQATVLVIPLLSGSGIKLKVLEGLASALPVVTTPMGAEGIEITHREHYLLARDKTEFINCTDELLKDAKLREGLSANGRNLIKEKYSWKAQTKKLEKFLEEVYSR